MKRATKAIHAGQEPDPRTGAVNTPVYLSSTFKQDGIGVFRDGYEYARTDNPSRRSLEHTLAALEGGRHGAAFASGSAAAAAVMDLLEPGDEVLTTIDVYGGTYRLFRQVYERYGLHFRFLDTADAGALLAAASDATRMIWVESPTNPLLNIHDIARLAAERPEGVRLVVDNTFATPYFQQPLALGADLVVHSLTKYLAGHSDVVGGAVVTSDDALAEKLRFYQNAAGAVPAPFDCYLVQRGIKTLAVRMERHAASALTIAEFLGKQPGVLRVYHPGLPEHPGHAIAQRQMDGYSGMVSFELEGGLAAAERFFGKTKLFTLAESLGGVESLTCHPYSMTHGAIPPEEKARIGISEALVRLSVGLEDVEDLLTELESALS